MLRFYAYAKCSTCQKARAWLEDHGIAFEEIAIKEQQPGDAELRAMLAAREGKLSRLFNTSGMDYRAMGLKDKLPNLTEAEAFALLQSNGMLVKRPFLIGDGVALVGFREKEWAAALG